jgi:hypothetical protein
METSHIILSFILVPFLGFFSSLLFSKKNEIALSRIAIYTTGFQLITVVSFIIVWIINDAPIVNLKESVIYQSKEYEFLLISILTK